MPLCQPSCISSRHYTSLDQLCHPVGRVVSSAIMWYLDVMRCKRVSGLVLWFRCIVSLHPSLKCLLPNERVVLVDSMGGREGWWEYIDGQFRRETLADMSLKEVGGDCLLNSWCCSSMVVYELMMEAWECRWYSLKKMSGTKRWLRYNNLECHDRWRWWLWWFLTVGRMSRSLYRDGELSTGGRWESKAISCVLFEM